MQNQLNQAFIVSWLFYLTLIANHLVFGQETGIPSNFTIQSLLFFNQLSPQTKNQQTALT